MAHIDILSYNRDVLAWNNQTSFPVSLLIHGLASFLYPLGINLNDPLAKSLMLQNQIVSVGEEEEEEA